MPKYRPLNPYALKTILLVDDEAIIALGEKSELEKRGYSVLTAYTGEKAVEMARSTAAIDLILMDIDLGPGMDGSNAAKAILQRRDIPIVFLSSHREPEVLALTEKITSYGYVVKTSGITILDASIKMAFKLFKANKRVELEKEHFRTTLNSIGDGVIVSDSAGNVTEMNPVAERLTGWKSAEARGRPIGEIFSIVNVHSRKPVENPIEKVLEQGMVVGLANHTLLVAKDGRERQIADSGAPIATADGGIAGVVLVFRDVSEEYRIREELRESEERFRLLYERAPIGYQSLDEDGRIIEVNPMWLEALGYTREEVIGRWFGDFLAPDYVETFRLRFPLFKAAGKIHSELQMVCKDGSVRFMAFEGRVGREPDGSFRQTHCVLYDITERARIEESLQKQIVALSKPLDDSSETQFSDLFSIERIQRIQDEFAEAADVASIITHPDGRPITKPSRFCRLCAEIIRKTEKGLENCYTSDAHIGGRNREGPVIRPCLGCGLWDAGASISVGGRHVANWLIGQIRTSSEDGAQSLDYADTIGVDRKEFAAALAEVPVMSKAQFESTARLLFILANELSQEAYQNVQQARFISDRKRAEEALKESEERYRSIIRTSLDGFWVVDPSGTILDANDEYCRMSGYPRERLLSMGIHELDILEADPEDVQRHISKLRRRGWDRFETRHRKADGGSFDAEVSVYVHNDQGAHIAFIRDISERRNSQAKIESLLREKELFLKEVHHRVKNNLNAMGSLLAIQADKAESSAAAVLEDAQVRLRSMGLLYEKLYRSDNVGEMSIGDYLPALVEEVVGMYPDRLGVRAETIVDRFDLPVAKLATLGILVNELLTNAMKHAFGDRPEGTIRVGAVERDGRAIVSVEDDGIGMPKGMGPASSSGLGLRLAGMLAEQLGGSMRIEAGEGTRIVVDFGL